MRFCAFLKESRSLLIFIEKLSNKRDSFRKAREAHIIYKAKTFEIQSKLVCLLFNIYVFIFILFILFIIFSTCVISFVYS